jgi:glycosyltransferase involved in cell wall biosynthesis
MRSIAIISIQAFSLVNFRGPLIRALTNCGVRVYALAPDFDDGLRTRVSQLGAVPMDFSLSRTGMNPLKDAVNIYQLSQLLRRLAPDAALNGYIKPVIYGSIAAWLARVPKRFSLIEGLGYVFLDTPESRTRRRRLLRWAVTRFYKFALGLNHKVFFLNKDDVSHFVGEGIVVADKVVRIDGIGLDLDYFTPVPPVLQPVTFIMIARMLREKGVYEFVEAARLTRERYPDVRFLLVGYCDENPSSVTETEMHTWAAEGIVEWPGQVDDVRPWLAQASVFVLPSYYSEGLPRGSQEAMAMGLPVITTDWVGCRETVQNGINGFLVPVRDPAALAQAMTRFVESPDLITTMGKEGRRIAEKRFDVHVINRRIMEVIGIVPPVGPSSLMQNGEMA